MGIYDETIEAIENLHDELGNPEEFADNESRTNTTGGNRSDPFWDADSIGDWDGDETAVAEAAQEELNEVYTALGLCGNGGIYNYYRSAAWADYVEGAEQIIDDFHDSGEAFDRLCD